MARARQQKTKDEASDAAPSAEPEEFRVRVVKEIQVGVDESGDPVLEPLVEVQFGDPSSGEVVRLGPGDVHVVRKQVWQRSLLDQYPHFLEEA
jgi:hypothetical protein